MPLVLALVLLVCLSPLVVALLRANELFYLRHEGGRLRVARGRIPQALLDHVLAEGPEQERMEAWIVDEVNNGAVLPGLYPMNAETKARYAASKK